MTWLASLEARQRPAARYRHVRHQRLVAPAPRRVLEVVPTPHLLVEKTRRYVHFVRRGVQRDHEAGSRFVETHRDREDLEVVPDWASGVFEPAREQFDAAEERPPSTPRP